jgi:genome maintenance exonuclease 1
MATAESLNLTETIDNKRYYNIMLDGKLSKLPSVTTILGAMTDHSSLDSWRKSVGEAEADRISTFSANRGTCMHQKLEYWFLSDIADKKRRFDDVNRKMIEFVKQEGYTQEELACGNKLFDSLYLCGFFERVDSIIEMENTLYSFEQGGYAGRVDCIYRNKEGKPVLLDFKTARKKKRPEWITNYYMQLSAYFLAYYQMHGVVLDHGELWIAVENDIPQLVIVSKDELKSWLKHFLLLVRNYHNQYDYLLENVSNNKNLYNLPF